VATAPIVHRLIIIGTGFMGASLAWAAKSKAVASEVIGLDPAGADQAKALGYVDQAIVDLSTCTGRSVAGMKTAIVVATPVSAMDQVFAAIEAFAATEEVAWVTDLGSTKAGVVKASALFHRVRPRFVSSHPMAGSEQQGAAHARADLFDGARVLVSPLAESEPEAVADVEDFWISIGAQPSLLPIEDHDALLAAISHLPHVLAYCLAASLADSSLAGAAQALHGGGLRDTTRIAASSAGLWADIFLDNRERLLESWAHWQVHQDAMKEALQQQDRELLVDLLDRAAHWRRGFL